MKQVVTTVIVCMIVSAVSGQEAKIDLDSLARVCQASEDGLSDIAVDYEFAVANPGLEKEKETVRQQNGFMYRGPKHVSWYGTKPFHEFSKATLTYEVEDRDGNVYSQTEVQSYNGITAKRYNSQKGTTTVQRGEVSRASYFVRPTGFYPLDFTSFYREDGKTIGEFLREAKGIVGCRLSLNRDIKRVNDFNSVDVEIWNRVAENREILTRRYTFSTDHNYTLVKTEIMNGKKVVCTLDVLKLMKLQNGIWFPVDCKAYAPDGLTNTIKVTRVVANQGLTAMDFDTVFPPGTRVDDAITGKSYTTKPTQAELDKTLPGK